MRRLNLFFPLSRDMRRPSGPCGIPSRLSTVARAMLALPLAYLLVAAPPATAETQIYGNHIWKPLRIGAGGFITGLDIARDGTRVIRADTYGAYIWDVGAKSWRQLVTRSSMPADDATLEKNDGVYEIRFAPSRPSRLYMSYRGFVYRSDDSGRRWQRTRLAPVKMEPNGGFRTLGQKLAVDPANPDVVYAGSNTDGVWTTADAGATWRRLESIPPGRGGAGISGIVFDPTSGDDNGRTRRIAIASWEEGIWQSTNAGADFRRLEGGPTTVRNAKVASDGSLLVADGKAAWKLKDGKWVNMDSARTWFAIAADPANPRRIVIIDDGGNMRQSHDGGASWSFNYGRGLPIRTRVLSPEIPWLEWAQDSYLSTADIHFDPAGGDLFYANGTGAWRTRFPESYRPFDWTSDSIGIEQLVTSQILVPPGGRPLVVSWDRPVFQIKDPDTFPASYGPSRKHIIVMGWAMDYAAADPRFLAGIFNWWGVEESGVSTDGGETWKPFAAKPPDVIAGKIGGSIAVASPTNIVWIPSNKSQPYVTKDGGATWTPAQFPGTSPDDEGAWGWAYFLRRHIVTADRVTPATFYAYHSKAGLFRSSDGGTTWTLVKMGPIADWAFYNAKLRSVPGHAGHLFFTAGTLVSPDHPKPSNSPLRRSVDGGVTWQHVSGVKEVWDIGFGKAKTDGGYPSVFIAGWVNNKWGIWWSDDNCASWERIGEFPLDSLDIITAISGDPNRYGRVYVGFAGSGAAYADLTTAK